MQAGDSVLFMMGVIVMNGNFNPYDVPPDDLPEGCTSKEKPVSVALLIWDKLPQILLQYDSERLLGLLFSLLLVGYLLTKHLYHGEYKTIRRPDAV